MAYRIPHFGQTEKRLEPKRGVDQVSPKRYYVYAHYDKRNVPFYIGKGRGKRAWSTDRHTLWTRYVNKHLLGEYQVKILIDDLSNREAEEIETEWIAQESETLVNWINFRRKTDFEKLQIFHKKRNANRELFAEAKRIEKTNIHYAIRKYKKALSAIAGYANIRYESGLVGMLRDEEDKDRGFNGYLEVIDRLTLCLCKTGNKKEAARLTKNYFQDYRSDLSLKSSAKVLKRVGLKASNL